MRGCNNQQKQQQQQGQLATVSEPSVAAAQSTTPAVPPVCLFSWSYNGAGHDGQNAVMNDGLKFKEGVIVAWMLRLMCMRGTQHDSILLHLGVRAAGGFSKFSWWNVVTHRPELETRRESWCRSRGGTSQTQILTETSLLLTDILKRRKR